MDEQLLTVLRRRPGWDAALGSLRQRLDQWGAQARASADSYAERYRGRRAAMVVDVVGSRQRKYDTRVTNMVSKFEGGAAARSLTDLARLGCPPLGLVAGEAETIRDVAVALCRFGEDTGGGDDDTVVARWAAATVGLDIAHRLDPYLGSVKGIGPALFCYARMRSGGDGLKPDVRLRRALRDLGFGPPPGDIALLVLGHALASEIGEPRLVLDQLLWTRPPGV